MENNNLPVYIRPCNGAFRNNICPYNCQEATVKYYYYCQNCFCHLFPKLEKEKHLKIKEIDVVNFVCHKYFDIGKWYHDKQLIADDNHERTYRRIDLRIQINDTIFCIEIDENQHELYTKINEIRRYIEIINTNKNKYVFIRYNPDAYNNGTDIVNPDKSVRFGKLADEIDKQIDRILNNENGQRLEINYLFYNSDNTNLITPNDVYNNIANIINNNDLVFEYENDMKNIAVLNDTDNIPHIEQQIIVTDDKQKVIRCKINNKKDKIIINTKKNNSYDCPKCDKHFDFQSELERHLSRIITCDAEQRNDEILIKRTCTYCDKVFTRIDTIPKHLKTCKEKIRIDTENKLINEELMRKEFEKQQNVDKEKQNSVLLEILMKEMHEVKQQLVNLKTYKKSKSQKI